MPQESRSRHGMWSSRWVFIVAVIGVAMGTGQIWGFAEVAHRFGGGAFVLAYVFALLLLGIPLLMAEMVLGRVGRLSPINTVRRLTSLSRGTTAWLSVGWFGTFAAMLVLSYLGVFAGWAMRNLWVMASGQLAGADASAAQAAAHAFAMGAWQVIVCQSVFMALVVYLVGRSFVRIERTIRYLMPAVLVAFVVLLGAAISLGDVGTATAYLLQPRWSEFGLAGALAALGQAVLTLGVGMGAIMAYSAFVPSAVSIVRTASMVVVSDALIAIGAGFIGMPIVFGGGIEPASGFNLLSVSVPLAFAQLPMGAWLGGVLFLLVIGAAVVAALALLEPILSYLVEEYSAKRARASISMGVICWAVGVGSVLSVAGAASLDGAAAGAYFGPVYGAVTTWLIPLIALGSALFVGFKLARASLQAQLGLAGGVAEFVCTLLMRIVVPVGIGALLVGAVWRSLA